MGVGAKAFRFWVLRAFEDNPGWRELEATRQPLTGDLFASNSQSKAK
jgi:hypothetical protein